MWYPGKFWRNISYSTIDGELRDELDHRGPSWKHRRRYRMAMRRNDDYLVAVPSECRAVVVEAWCDTVEHRFRSVTVRCDLPGDRRCWIETRTERGGATFARGDRRLSARSGPLEIETTDLVGRTVSIVQPEHGSVGAADLTMVPLYDALAAA